MTEDELLLSHDQLQAEIHDTKQKIQRAEDDITHIAGQLERAQRGEQSHIENLKTLVKSPVISIKAFKDARAGLLNFRMLQSSLSDKREKLKKTRKQLKEELPKLLRQYEDFDQQLDELEREKELKVIEVDFRHDEPGS